MSLDAAAADDLPAVADLVNAGYRGERSKAGWTTEADFITGDRITVARLEADSADPAVHILILRDDGGETLRGCVRLEQTPGGAWMLGMLAVRPVDQAQGSGRRLLEGSEAFARERGGRVMRMTVITIRDVLLAWYARRGYADTGEREPYAYGGALREDLEFAVLEKAL